MNSDIRKYHLFVAILVFVVLPVMFLALQEFPRRALLKETISLLTVLAFAATLSQLFLARSNRYFVSAFRFSRVLGFHNFKKTDTGFSEADDSGADLDLGAFPLEIRAGFF